MYSHPLFFTFLIRAVRQEKATEVASWKQSRSSIMTLVGLHMFLHLTRFIRKMAPNGFHTHKKKKKNTS